MLYYLICKYLKDKIIQFFIQSFVCGIYINTLSCISTLFWGWRGATLLHIHVKITPYTQYRSIKISVLFLYGVGVLLLRALLLLLLLVTPMLRYTFEIWTLFQNHR